MGKTSLSWKEVLFQLSLHALVFVFFSIDRRHPEIEIQEWWFFLAYATSGLVISYWLLPRFFYRKRYLPFFLGLTLVVTLSILCEELVLEQIFYPDDRGKVFSSVFYSLLDVMPVITILVGFKFAWDALNKQQEVDRLREAVAESELQFLKSQINPHFLFNNLNNLYSHALENSPKTPEIILELSAVLRYMLYECKEAYVKLEKEITQLKNFIQLYELQIEDRGTVTFKSSVDSEDWQVAPLILPVFVENAFKHSQSGLSEGLVIEVDLSLSEEGKLRFCCRNNYAPQPEQQAISSGIGLANVRKRLELLYPDQYELNILEDQGWYKVDLTIQLQRARI
ncbi:MAG: histidine kinase [Bacteroidota bacterium]